MKKWISAAAMAIGWLVILEVGSTAILRVFWPRLRSYRESYQELAQKIEDTKLKNIEPVARPFFGYVKAQVTANNRGFNSSESFPYRKNGAEFVIGFFGGSVADYFYKNLDQKSFTDRLKKAVPNLRTSKITYLNFALGCYKQPQQFSVYSYFYDSFDMSINIDGYNEISFIRKGAPVEDPCWTYYLYANSDEVIKLRKEIGSVWTAKESFNLFFLKAEGLQRSSFVFLLWKAVTHQLENKAHELDRRASSVNPSPFAQEGGAAGNEDIARDGAVNWGRYTRFESQLAKLGKKTAIFVIQPNLYVKNSKPFSQEEIALMSNSKNLENRRSYVTLAYDYLRKELEISRSVNPYIFDFSGIFKGHSEPIYTDDCCHVNSHGNDLITEELLKMLQSGAKKNPEFLRKRD